MQRNARLRKSGFTLIEILLAIVIIAAVVAITIPAYSSWLQHKRDQNAVDRGQILDVQKSRYLSEQGGAAVAAWAAAVDDNARYQLIKGELVAPPALLGDGTADGTFTPRGYLIALNGLTQPCTVTRLSDGSVMYPGGGTGTSYLISVSPDDAARGATLGGGTYESGSTVTVTAQPFTGSMFVRWTEGGVPVSTDAAYSFAAGSARTLVAEFVASPAGTYALTILRNNTAAGTVSAVAGSYASGTVVSPTATPNAGWVFDSWTGDIGAASASATTIGLTMDRDRTVQANFVRTSVTVSLVSNNAAFGSVSGGGVFPAGTSTTLTATPFPGYQFVKWLNGATLVSNAAAFSYTASADVTLTAEFALEPNTGVIAGTYGGPGKLVKFSVDAQGRLLDAQESVFAVNLGDVSGAGTMAAQNADNVNISGGTISNVTFTALNLVNPTVTGGSINNTPIGATNPNSGRFSSLEATGAALARIRATTTTGGVNLINEANDAPAYGGVAGGYVGTTSAHPLQFITNGVVRMDIDAAGTVKVGGTTLNPNAYVLKAGDTMTGALNAPSFHSTTDAAGGFFAAGRDGNGTSSLYRNAGITHITDDTFGDVMTYDTSANIGLGVSAPTAGMRVRVGGPTNGAVAYGLNVSPQIQTSASTAYYGVISNPTVASAAAIPSLYHFSANHLLLTGGATITNQIGFYASGSLTKGASNMGFRGDINAAANRWNLYMAGTAQNYLAGDLGVGTAAVENASGWERVVELQGANNSRLLVSQTGLGIRHVNSVHSTGFYTGGAAGAFIGTESAHPLQFITNGSVRMDIDASGNVRVGGTALNPGAYVLKAGDTMSGDLSFSGTGRRIKADMNNATHANRFLFQNSVANGGSALGVLPNGTGTSAAFTAYSSSDPDNAIKGQLYVTPTSTILNSGHTGSATTQPLSLAIDDLPALTIAPTTRNVSIGGTPVTGARLDLYGTNASASGPHFQTRTDADAYPLFQALSYSHDNISLAFDGAWDGTWKSSHAGSNYSIYKVGGILRFRYSSGNAPGAGIAWNEGLTLDTSGVVNVPGTFQVAGTSVTPGNYVTLNTAQTITAGKTISYSDAQLRVANANNGAGVGTYYGDTFGAGQFGYYNTSGATVGVVPTGTSRTFFGYSWNGAVGSMTSNYGSALAFRNYLDDGSGNVQISGRYNVQNGQDGGTGRGIAMWGSGDNNWGIYMGQSGASKSFSGGTAVAGYDFAAYAIRSRAGNNSAYGFIWENNSEQLLASLNASSGNFYTKGHVIAGGDVNATGRAYVLGAYNSTDGGVNIRSTSPSIVFDDTDTSTSWMTHNNGDSITWYRATSYRSGAWQLKWQMDNTGSTSQEGSLSHKGGYFQSTQHGDYHKTYLAAASNGAGTGEAGLYTWISEPSMTWTGAGIARNMNLGSLNLINPSLTGQMIRFNEGTGIEFSTRSGATVTTPFSVQLGYTQFTGSMVSTNGWMVFQTNAQGIANADTSAYVQLGTNGAGGGWDRLVRMSTGGYTFDCNPNGQVYSTFAIRAPSYNATSSRRFKEHVESLSPSDLLRMADRLRPVSYDWKKGEGKGGHDLGFIAEEVAEIFPESVSRDDDGQVSGLDYGRLSVVAIGAIKELKRENTAIKAESARLAQKLESLESRFARLEQRRSGSGTTPWLFSGAIGAVAGTLITLAVRKKF